ILIGAVFALLGWFVWAYLTYWIGTRVLPEPQTSATHGELLRTIGFASAPGILRVLGLIPPLREIVFLAAGIWMLVATVVAVRQALDYHSTLRAVGVCALGWLIQMVIITIVVLLLGGGGRPA
ncbi:MAG: YIP1 family protein, partial [Candidatus Methylomirabilia bacterium]